jgi:hypothetical protein
MLLLLLVMTFGQAANSSLAADGMLRLVRAVAWVDGSN